jgi:hypothetical protein
MQISDFCAVLSAEQFASLYRPEPPNIEMFLIVIKRFTSGEE